MDNFRPLLFTKLSTPTMKPMLDPKRDLKGATPKTLARALLKPLRRPSARAETVFGYQIPVEKGPPDKPLGRRPHLRKRS